MARHFASLPLSVLFAVSVIQGFSDALEFLEEPDHTTATIGDKVAELKCVADDKSAQIAWFKGNPGTQITEDFVHLTFLVGSMRIFRIRKDDAGSYYCKASTSLETVTSRTATLTVQYICDAIQLKADPNVVFHNEDVDLKCNCSGVPSPSYTWTKDGRLLGDSGKVLRISKAQLSDSGIYQCTANSSVRRTPRNSSQYTLNIIDGAPPKIITPPRGEVAFVIKGTVMLDCVATGNPTPVVKWYKDSNKALRSNSVMQVFANGSLYFKEINREHAGSYKCSATNKYDSSKSFESKLVQARIGNIGPLYEQVVRLGNSLFVKCETPKANPVILNVEWTLGNGDPLPSDGRFTVAGNELQIRNTNKNDSGIYQCIARNIAGEKRLNVTVIVAIFPEVLQNPQNRTVIEGEDTILECRFSGDPKPKIVWGKNGEALPTDQDYKINGSQLLIEKARPEFNGLYSCEASIGRIKRRSKKAQLKVREKIRIIKSDRYKFDVGSTARLRCVIRGEKPWTITWSKVGSKTKLLPPHITKEGALLSIKKSKLDDSGNYTCEAANSFSSSSTIMVLNIYKRPVIVLYPKNVTAKLNGTALFHCNMTGYPTPSIVWYRNIPGQEWKQLKNNDHVKLFPSNGSVRFKNIRKSDQSGYTCFGGNAGGFAQVTIYLYVKEATTTPGSNDNDMLKTVGIAVGCAGAYIILVVGLMIYCKGRRARQAKNKLVIDGEEVPLNHAADANNVEVIKTADTKLQFPRHDLEALRTLGNGSYGNVFLAKASEIVEGESTSIVVVQSLTSKDEEVKKEFMETMVKLSLKHQNIAKLLGVCQEDDPMYLISEYPEQGDLKTVMRDSSPLTPTQKVNICAEVALGMNYLTNHGRVHKDLAARNCLVNKSFNVKISFLSLNQGTYPKEYYKRNGELIPLRWMAPEALKGEFDEVSDVWAFGIFTWEVYTEGMLPYEERSDEEVYKSVPYDLRLTKPESCPGKIFKMMEQCWEEESEDRPTFGQLCEDFSEIPRENDF